MDVGHLGEPRQATLRDGPRPGAAGAASTVVQEQRSRVCAGPRGGITRPTQKGTEQRGTGRLAPHNLLSSCSHWNRPGISGRGRSSGYRSASPIAPSLRHRRRPNRRSAQRAAHSKCTPPVGAGPQAGQVSAVAPALKDPAPCEHCACPAVERGGTGDSGRAPRAAGWRHGLRPVVAARRLCACQCPRRLGQRAGHVQDPGAGHSRGL